MTRALYQWLINILEVTVVFAEFPCVLGYWGQPTYDRYSKIHFEPNLSTMRFKHGKVTPQYLIFRVAIRAKLRKDIHNVEIGVHISTDVITWLVCIFG